MNQEKLTVFNKRFVGYMEPIKQTCAYYYEMMSPEKPFKKIITDFYLGWCIEFHNIVFTYAIRAHVYILHT